MSFVYKEKYERRARGFESVIGHNINIIWGNYHPKTDGVNIWLPDQRRETFQTEDDFRCAFSHEIAHIVFDTDTQNMAKWIDAYDNGSRLHFHDPFGLMGQIAEDLINCLEDHRVDSLYGELLPGAGDRFAEVKYRKSPENDDISEDPLVIVYYLRSEYWNRGFDWDRSPYQEAKEEWEGTIDIDAVWSEISDLEYADPEQVFHAAENIMQELLPWYEDRIKFAIDDDDIEDIQGDIEDVREDLSQKRKESEELGREIDKKESEKINHEADGEFDEAEKLQDEIDDLEREKREVDREIEKLENRAEVLEKKVKRKSRQAKEETEELRDLREDKEDIKDRLEADWDFEDVEWEDSDEHTDGEKMEKRLDDVRSKLYSGQSPNIQPSDSVPTNVIERRPSGPEKGHAYAGIVDDITTEFSRIYGRKRHRRSETGQELDIDAFIDTEIQNSCEMDVMVEELLEIGFNCSVVLDLSMSMVPHKLEICRNVGLTLWKSLDEIQDMGMDVNFEIIGYGGGTMGDDVLIRQCESIDDVRRLAHHPSYCTTPTWHGVNWARSHMRQYEGDKVMVIITDGTPTGIKSNGDELSEGKALRYTRREIKEARQMGIEVFTLGIDVSLDDNTMRRVYGEYENVDSEKEAGDLFLEFIRDSVREHMVMM